MSFDKWATLEHLHHVNRCRTLFATHYHELTALAARLTRLLPHAMRVKAALDEAVAKDRGVKSAQDRLGAEVEALNKLESKARDAERAFDKAVDALVFKQARNLRLKDVESAGEGAPSETWRSALALDEGMEALRDDGLRKAAAGMTSIQEIARVVK